MSTRLSVLALDYDGTIAEEGHLDPEVHAAIQEVRARGLVVVLVTGRIFADLLEAAGDLLFVDGVVAENGAVVVFPDSGRTLRLASELPPSFAAQLRARGVDVRTGSGLLEAAADAAPVILQLVRQQELPLVLLFNRGRLMVLPQGVSKATGLREALRALRLSVHNTVAIGDAENDHALLEAAEVGVAVAWGSPALKAAADLVLTGTGPPDVARFIRQVGSQANAVPARIRPSRRQLLLGQTSSGRRVDLAVEGRNVLVAGEPRSGKSYVVGLLAEQLILRHYSVCVLDVEGDYRSLETLPGVLPLGGAGPLPRPHELANLLRNPDLSLVLDLSRLPHDQKRSYVQTVLPLLAASRQSTGVPHRIVLDEAHYFLAEADGAVLADVRRGGYTIATYRPSSLQPDVIASTELILLTRLSDQAELQSIAAARGARLAQTTIDAVRGLSIGSLALLAAPATRPTGEQVIESKVLGVAPRLTPHVRHRQKYLDTPISEEHAFVFSHEGCPFGKPVQTFQALSAALEGYPAEVLDGHLRRGDLSRWVADVFGDTDLALQIQEVERLYRFNQLLDPRDALVELIRQRYVSEGEGASSPPPVPPVSQPAAAGVAA